MNSLGDQSKKEVSQEGINPYAPQKGRHSRLWDNSNEIRLHSQDQVSERVERLWSQSSWNSPRCG